MVTKALTSYCRVPVMMTTHRIAHYQQPHPTPLTHHTIQTIPANRLHRHNRGWIKAIRQTQIKSQSNHDHQHQQHRPNSIRMCRTLKPNLPMIIMPIMPNQIRRPPKLSCRKLIFHRVVNCSSGNKGNRSMQRMKLNGLSRYRKIRPIRYR